MTIVRYRQLPAELDGVLVTPETVAEAVAFLRQYGRDSYQGIDALRVLSGDGLPAFNVPYGHVLIRDAGTGGFAPITLDELRTDRYVAVGAVRPPPPPLPAARRGALDRPLGQPGRGL